MTTNCAPSSATSVREDRSRATSRNPAAISSSGAAPSEEAAGPGSPTVSSAAHCGDDRHHREDRRRPAHAQEHPGRGRREEDAGALDPGRDDVGGSQLLGAPRHAGHQRSLGRTRERDRGRRRGGQRVDEQRRSIRKDGYRGRTHRHRLRDVAPRQHPRRPSTVGQHGAEGRAQARGHEQRQRNETRRRRPALLVGEDEHRDPGPPLGRVEGDERELDAPQLRVAEDRGENPPGHGQRAASRDSTAERITRSTPGTSAKSPTAPPSG